MRDTILERASPERIPGRGNPLARQAADRLRDGRRSGFQGDWKFRVRRRRTISEMVNTFIDGDESIKAQVSEMEGAPPSLPGTRSAQGRQARIESRHDDFPDSRPLRPVASGQAQFQGSRKEANYMSRSEKEAQCLAPRPGLSRRTSKIQPNDEAIAAGSTVRGGAGGRGNFQRPVRDQGVRHERGGAEHGNDTCRRRPACIRLAGSLTIGRAAPAAGRASLQPGSLPDDHPAAIDAQYGKGYDGAIAPEEIGSLPGHTVAHRSGKRSPGRGRRGEDGEPSYEEQTKADLLAEAEARGLDVNPPQHQGRDRRGPGGGRRHLLAISARPVLKNTTLMGKEGVGRWVS